MPISEILILTLGSSISKALVKIWLNDPQAVSDFAADLADLFKSKTSDILLQKRATRQFESIGEKVAEDLLPIFENEKEFLSEESREAIALAIASTFDKSELDTGLLASQNLDARNLSKFLLESSVQSVIGFSSQEKELFDRVIIEASKRIVDIASGLPSFSERTLGEILKREDQLLDIANRILSVVRESRQPKVRYFMTLDGYLSRPGSRFPKAEDFAQNLVFYPQEKVEEAVGALEANNCCLITGRSASGKTVLAIVLAKHLQDTIGYQTFYTDASRAIEGDGREWYRTIYDAHNTKSIFIIDNCHRAPDEVNDLCFQLDDTTLGNNFIIFVSRFKHENLSHAVNEIGDYFDTLSECRITIKAEEIYEGILKNFSAALQLKDPHKYVALENDNERVLESQHSHNLVSSRSRLDAWRLAGGKLSNVMSKEIFAVIAEKYLRNATNALPVLCALHQFEIPAHNLFVEDILPKEEINILQNEHLLNTIILPNYGKIYELNLHPEEAKEIILANIYLRQGFIGVADLQAATVRYLSAYLMQKPLNYLWVYSGVYREKHDRVVLRSLLTDAGLQAVAFQQLSLEQIDDAISYLSLLAKVDPKLAITGLDSLLPQNEITNLARRLEEYNWTRLAMILNRLYIIDNDVARSMLGQIELRKLLANLDRETFHSLWLLFLRIKKILPEKTDEFLLELTDAQLALTTRGNKILFVHQSSFQAFMWKIRRWKALSHELAHKVIDALPLDELAARASMSDGASIGQVLKYFSELSISSDKIKSFIDCLDLPLICQNARTRSVSNLDLLLRELKKVSPRYFEIFAANLSPSTLADMCRSEKITGMSFKNVLGRLPQKYRREFINQFSPNEISYMFERFSLGVIGFLLQHYYSDFSQGYQLFSKNSLRERLADAAFNDIGRFIHRLRETVGFGEQLLEEVLQIICSLDITDRVRTDLRHYNTLVWVASEVNKEYAFILINNFVNNSDAIKAALSNGNIDGIQRLIENAREFSPSCCEVIGNALEPLDIKDKFDTANLKELGHFIWSIYLDISPDLARKYCGHIDHQIRDTQVLDADIRDLNRFVWNLVQVGNLEEYESFKKLSMRRKLRTSLQSSLGQGLFLLGVLSTVGEDINLQPSSLNKKLLEAQLTAWFKQAIDGGKPHEVVVTIRGLRVWDEQTSNKLVRRCVSLWDLTGFLSEAVEKANTSMAKSLIQEVRQWLSGLLFQETIDEIDMLVNKIETAKKQEGNQ